MPDDPMPSPQRETRSNEVPGGKSGYKVRQVTSYQASWMQTEPGEEGEFTLQLILDNGVTEEILTVDSDDLEILLTLLKRSGMAMFDLERRVLMFNNLDVD